MAAIKEARKNAETRVHLRNKKLVKTMHQQSQFSNDSTVTSWVSINILSFSQLHQVRLTQQRCFNLRFNRAGYLSSDLD